MYLIYNSLLWICFVLYLPFLTFRVIKGRTAEVRERLGFLPPSLCNRVEGESVIWIHGVSVGETVAAGPICAEIRRRFPKAKIVFSTITDTGRNMAERLIDADAFFYFPFDLPVIVKKVLTKINPKIVIIMETELWPNFIRTAQQIGSKVVLANGRISDKSYRGYKLFGPLLREMLTRVDAFTMQSLQDVEYILALGAEKEKVFNFGNTKYDLNIDREESQFKNKLAQELQIANSTPILVVGSTHANEEELLIPVYKRLKADYRDLLMILAPRHPERLKEIEPLFRKAGISTVRRTELKNKKRKEPVVLVDTIGELLSIYSLADLVFVGGSLVNFGGHNILEPAAYGKTIFIGPHMNDFKDILKLFLKHDACIQVKDNVELEEKLLYYLKNRDQSDKKGQNAHTIVRTNQGATKRILDLVAKLLME